MTAASRPKKSNAISRGVDLELKLLARARKPRLKKSSQPKEPAIHLGTDQVTGKKIQLTLKTFFVNNLYIVGAARTGKTRLILYILIQLLFLENTCIIVPVAKGDLGKQFRNLVLSLGMGHRLIWIDPEDYGKGISIGLDLLRANNRQMSTHVDTVREALVLGHGQPNMDETKQMARVMHNSIYAARSANLTSVEAKRLLMDKEFRLNVREKVTNPDVLEELIYWDTVLTPMELNRLLAPSIARWEELTNNEVLCAMIGQQLHSLDFPEAMREGKIIIFNLVQNITLKFEPLRLLGRAVINLIIDAQFQIFGSGMHTILILDECQSFATPDLARCLDQMLEVNLHVIAAHHHLSQFNQLGEYAEAVKDSFLNNCGIKVVFRLNNFIDSKFWSEQIFSDQVDLLKEKYFRMDRRFAPEEHREKKKTYTKGGAKNWDTATAVGRGVTDQNIHTDIEAHGEGEGEVDSMASISGSQRATAKIGMSGAMASTGKAEFDGTESPIITYHEGENSSGGKTDIEGENDGLVIGNAKVKNRTHVKGTADTKGTATSIQTTVTHRDGGSSNWSESETIERFTRYVEYWEKVDIQHYSTDEQIFTGAQVINKSADRYCLIKFPGVPVIQSKTANMFDTVLDEAELEQKMLPVYAQPCYSKVEDIEHEIEVRQAPFQAKAHGGKKGKVV